MKKVRIRPATKEDRPAIKALIRMFPKKLMQTHVPTYKSFFVAEKGGIVVGCCALQVYTRRMAEIRSLAVHPDHERNGIGISLAQACDARAKKLKIIEVGTQTGAPKLFEKLGYRTFFKEKYAMIKVLADEPEESR